MTRNDVLALVGATLAAARRRARAERGPGEPHGLFVGSNKEISNPMHLLEAALAARDDDGTVDHAALRRAGVSGGVYPLFYVEGLQAALAVLHLPGASG